ncbi:MAG: diguanylate cyclase [Sphingobium sp.]
MGALSATTCAKRRPAIADFPDIEAEAERLAKLRSFRILDTPDERELDAVTALAQRLIGCPIALVSLVDEHRQWFKSRQGLDATETHRDHAFCAHTIHEDDIFIVTDATQDTRFADNPLVQGAPFIRFYAGMPLRPSAPGFSDDLPGIGSLCVIDTQPRILSEEDAAILRDLATVVSGLIRARSSANSAITMAELAETRANILDRKHRQLGQAERMAGLGSWRMELSEQRLDWSEQMFVIHGLEAGVVPQLSDALRFYPDADKARVQALLQRASEKGEPFDLESDFITADGRQRRVRAIGEPEIINGNLAAIIGVFQDVTDRYLREEALRISARTDSLTGLANRAGFERQFAKVITAAEAEGHPFALLLIDLDGFKAVNDSFGHDAGDEILKMVADRMRGPDFAHAFPARLGGDEFALIVTRPRDCAELEKLVGALLGRLCCEIERQGQVCMVSATIGAVVPDRAGRLPSDLMRDADIALYEAKRHRRGTGRIFGTTIAIEPR